MNQTEVRAAIAKGEDPYIVAAIANAKNGNGTANVHKAPEMEDTDFVSAINSIRFRQ